VARDRGTGQGAMEPVKKGPRENQRSDRGPEVRGQAECRGTGIDIGRGRDRDRRQGTYPPVSLEERP